MPTLFVFEFEVYDRRARRWRRDGRLGLPTSIAALEAAILVVGSGVEVDAGEVDATGFYAPEGGGPGKD